MPIHAIYKIVHQRGHAIMLWRAIITNVNGAWPVLARIYMQARDSMKIQGANDVLREETGVGR